MGCRLRTWLLLQSSDRLGDALAETLNILLSTGMGDGL
jgi:hypothetical protein